jgi:hypothetical protein
MKRKSNSASIANELAARFKSAIALCRSPKRRSVKRGEERIRRLALEAWNRL